MDFRCNDGVSDLRFCPKSGVLDECAVGEITNYTSDDSELVHCLVSKSLNFHYVNKLLNIYINININIT